MKSTNDLISKKIETSGKLRGKLKGFTMIANWFIEQPGFSIYEKMVVVVIKKHLMYKEAAWPSLAKISREAGCSVSSVKKAIRNLEQRKILIRQRPTGRKSTSYQIKLDRVLCARVVVARNLRSGHQVTDKWAPGSHE